MKDKIINCYILKPVVGDSKDLGEKDYWPGYNENIVFTSESIDSFLKKMLSENIVHYDSALRYITSFEYQKEMIINFDCYNHLSNPD